MFITDGRNSGGTCIGLSIFLLLGWTFSPYPIISWIFYAIPILYVIGTIRTTIISINKYFKKRKLRQIMTTRQTGGLNKDYKPTSPASA